LDSFVFGRALGLKGDLDGGKTALAESLRLKPQIDSIAHFRDLRPYYSSPQTLELEEHRVMDGLRRLGFRES
jgi:hypothetical protein